jgi:hypothetical protein
MLRTGCTLLLLFCVLAAHLAAGIPGPSSHVAKGDGGAGDGGAGDGGDEGQHPDDGPAKKKRRSTSGKTQNFDNQGIVLCPRLLFLVLSVSSAPPPRSHTNLAVSRSVRVFRAPSSLTLMLSNLFIR